MYIRVWLVEGKMMGSSDKEMRKGLLALQRAEYNYIYDVKTQES